MKTITLFALAFLALSPFAFPQAAGPKVVQSFKDVLKYVPEDLRQTKASAWTRVQREVANEALNEALIVPKTPAKMRLKVNQVADWNGLTLFSEIPNQEGYHIRVFGKFAEDWKAKLGTLKKGDIAIIEGVLKSVTYRDLWGRFTLSICVQDCTFRIESADRIDL